MGVFIKRTGGSKDIGNLKAHLKYIGFRSREKKDDKGFFSKDSNNANYKDFINRVKDNKALRHPKSIKAHKLVFSLREEEYKAYKRSNKDYKDLIRETIKEYEDKYGMKLDWIASIHEEQGHPHVHVVIKGVSEDRDKKWKRIFFRKEDFKELKDIFNKEFSKEVEYKEYERIDLKSINLDISKGIQRVLDGISYEIKKDERETEIKKRRSLRKKEQEKYNNSRER